MPQLLPCPAGLPAPRGQAAPLISADVVGARTRTSLPAINALFTNNARMTRRNPKVRHVRRFKGKAALCSRKNPTERN
ncbi:hypothetical protein GWI33_010480 [Rhynchophorus ferrugineus]|uniref:Uncharacterized protein n=1 Tax=Rhynchophorus ferrugineus TaxID=354439 RepID=A0A834MMA9_RHYFE|nr:hypothetical protein GWI33_010480 [Rhynchophorus ferrugineus]